MITSPQSMTHESKMRGLSNTTHEGKVKQKKTHFRVINKSQKAHYLEFVISRTYFATACPLKYGLVH